MRSAAILLSAALLAAGSSAEARRARSDRSPSVAPARVPADIQSFFASYFKAVEGGDPEAILAHIDDDFVIKWPVGPAITDRMRVREALRSLQQRVRQEIRWGIDEAHVAGDWAWVRSWETPTHHPKAGGDPVTLEGSRLTILRRVNGRWLMHRDYASLNKLPGSTR